MRLIRFSQTTLPGAYRRQILSSTTWNKLCRGWVLHTYAEEAVKAAQIIWVAVQEKQVKGFVLVLTHNFKTILDGRPRPVCKPDEWYIDVACATHGTGIMKRVSKDAVKAGKRAIRLYSIEDSIPIWKRHGFKECDSCSEQSSCRPKTYKKDATQFRMIKCL